MPKQAWWLWGATLLLAPLALEGIKDFRKGIAAVREAGAHDGPAAPAHGNNGDFTVACQDAVRKHLAAPLTASFSWGDAGKVTGSWGSYRLESEVEAKNLYGVPLTRGFVCTQEGSSAVAVLR